MASLQDIALGRKDILLLDPRVIQREDGWNNRHKTPELAEHIRSLADSIREVGIKKPLTVKRGGDKANAVPVLVDGHCRLDAVELLLAEGLDLKSVPCIVVDTRYVSEVDLLLDQVHCNSGKSLTPLEEGEVYKRALLLDPGLTVAALAKKVGKAASTVDSRLKLQAAPEAIKEAVKAGEVSENTAVKAIKSTNTPQEAAQVVQEAQENAKAEGKAKATPQHLPSASKGVSWGKVGPELRDILREVLAAADGAKLPKGHKLLDVLDGAREFMAETFSSK